MSNNERFRRSLLDRLLADSRDGVVGQVLTYSLDQLRDSVARDVEALLNSRAVWDVDALDDYPAVCRSVLSFGIKDFVKFLGRMLVMWVSTLVVLPADQ